MKEATSSLTNREIKFRAWDTKKKGWKGLWIFRGGHVGEYDVSKDKIDILNLTERWNRHIILQQFTGLHDINGKEIWEGDIVKDIIVGMPSEIVYTSYANFGLRGIGRFALKDLEYNLIDPAWTKTSVIVIGNIYEDKNLLK